MAQGKRLDRRQVLIIAIWIAFLLTLAAIYFSWIPGYLALFIVCALGFSAQRLGKFRRRS